VEKGKDSERGKPERASPDINVAFLSDKIGSDMKESREGESGGKASKDKGFIWDSLWGERLHRPKEETRGSEIRLSEHLFFSS